MHNYDANSPYVIRIFMSKGGLYADYMWSICGLVY
ncbi:hypothetical protein ABIE26_001186 [Pedobacter africanus]|uniref:Uncharacterized protein n=1 Tax=Pedobacter africanus TaxID=151894 RepID=A0ACC6KTA1_9SPHI|nr:hypothetical protein [Pedobacter africanus]